MKGHIFGPRERLLACIISIGTGVPTTIDVGRKIGPLLETLKAISVNTEKFAREFRRDAKSAYPGQNIYFRFNFQHGLGEIEPKEWKELDRIKIATQGYLNENRNEVESCAPQILEPIGM